MKGHFIYITHSDTEADKCSSQLNLVFLGLGTDIIILDCVVIQNHFMYFTMFSDCEKHGNNQLLLANSNQYANGSV